MAWCEENHVEYVFGLASERSVAQIGTELKAAEWETKETGALASCFREFMGRRSRAGAGNGA